MKASRLLQILVVLLFVSTALPSILAEQQTVSQPAPQPQKKEPSPPVKTRFDMVPAADPRREIIQTVLGSEGLTTGLMTEAGWKAAGFHMAWQRVGQYFPQAAYFTTAREHFLTHFFNPSGFQEIEIFDSDYLRRCVQNRGTFTRQGVVGAYQGMLNDDPAEAAFFSRKLGPLEPYFRDEASKEKLRDMVGGELFDRLLKELREEGYHMFAGALVHEGVHALMDDPGRVAAIQEEYKACKIPVQWDELRAYMAEISYHARFYSWAVGDIFASWKQVENLLRELEKLRSKPKPLSQADKDRLEAVKAKIKIYIALIRLRMREIEVSCRRMEGLMAGFLKDHLKPKAAASDRKMLDSLLAAVNNFTKTVGEELQRQELLLKGLESYLDLWNRWASCELKTPPDRKIVDEIIKKGKSAKWPAAPLRQAEELRKKGDKEVAKFLISSGATPGGPSGPEPDRLGSGALSDGRNFSVTTYYVGTFASMDALNGYLDYLNETWEGDVPSFGRKDGFGAAVGYRISPALEAGLSFERISARVSGRLVLSGGNYVSSHSLNSFGVYLAARTAELLPAVRLVAKVGVSYCDARYTETENGFVTTGRDGAIGWTAAAGPEIELADNLSLSLLGGYRGATLDGFGVSFFMPGDPPVRLEFSGLMVQTGLSLRF